MAFMVYPTPSATPPNGVFASGAARFPFTVLASSRAVLSGRFTAATIVISQATGKITSIFDSVLPSTDFPLGTPYVDYSPHFILPGLVDSHVHLNEPGRTEWEGFWTGTRAAAFGGVTTVIDMPLNAIPPTTTVDGLEQKVAAAQGKCWVDVGFYGGIVPGNESELKGLAKAGVKGFKAFLIDSGVEEFPAVSSTDIAKAMVELADESTMLMFHAEMIPPVADSVGVDVQTSLPPIVPVGPLNEYSTFLASRPAALETYAISEILSLASLAPNLPLHIVHLSAAETVPLLREAQSCGVKITAETCFHYLSLAAELIRHGDTRHKCCPPIRSQSNQDALWSELLRENDSAITTIVSDHSPCTPNLKLLPPSIAGSDGNSTKEVEGDFFAAWGGVSSVGYGLSILWTEGEKRGITAEDIVKWCCLNTSKQVGLENQKGDLRVGMDGDLVIFDDEATFEVGPDTMLFRNKCSPYQGKTLKGVVKETWLRGQRIFQQDGGFGAKGHPVGQLLLEPRIKLSPVVEVCDLPPRKLLELGASSGTATRESVTIDTEGQDSKMTTKKERLTDEELLAQFEGIDDDAGAVQVPPKPATGSQPLEEADLFEELGIADRQRPASRPHTPRLGNPTSASAGRSSPKPQIVADARRSSEDKANLRSGDNTRPFHTSFAPDDEKGAETESWTNTKSTHETEPAPIQNTGGGWWGGIFATATAAVKQAEALAKEIKHNEEAQRWAEQVKGNVGALRGLGGELRSRALPTFTNILHTLAPPISSHERLQIHITHDIVGYPSLDPIIYQTFSRVMVQVEGGDLMVIQRGQESSPRPTSDVAGFTGSIGAGGWSDGPWWRQSAEARDLGAVKGLIEGKKLSRANAESYATDYFSTRGGLEQAAKHATEVLSESNPVRSSDIFLSIQAIRLENLAEVSGGSSIASEKMPEAVDDREDEEALISFAIYLHDPIHGITFDTITQTLPQKWIDWLDASPTSGPPDSNLPAEIADIVQTGGMDPREWVAEWVEELLSLGIGIVAQRYVARRMGVGEQAGLGRGLKRQEALESGGGEAARAV